MQIFSAKEKDTAVAVSFWKSAVEISDLLGAAGMTQLTDGLVFDLADTLTIWQWQWP